MALYEGIALIQEKQAVVLDLGTEYTKFGFTGEAAPRCIIRSEYWSPEERCFKQVFDYRTPEELYDNLVHMLHLLYFRHVLVNPKERKVVVVESLLAPTLLRETLARVLFTHYEVSGVVWADSARLCALTLGAPVVLVVALGGAEAEVVAVVHGVPVLRAMQAQPLGARAIHAELGRRLRRDNPDAALPDHVLEDIKVRMCFVPSRERALAWLAAEAAGAGEGGAAGAGEGGAAGDGEGGPRGARGPAGAGEGGAAGAGAGDGDGEGGPRGARYPLAAGALRVSGRARALAAEPLFARDNELASLPDIVLQCIMQCPIDTRRALAENVLVTGGTAALPGLRARLAEELRHLVEQPPYSERLHVRTFKFHSAPAHENAAAWLGGALCGGAGGGRRALPRDQYARAPRPLRDWSCLLHNTPADHPHWAEVQL